MTENYRLPENAEASIVGCVLLCPDTKPAVAKLVSEGDFSSPAYGAMFLAAMELDEPDSTAFHDAVKRRGYSLPDGFFAGLGDVAVSRHNVELYARLLREDSQKRQLKELSRQIRELTDEEILQILDFNSTREYVLEQNPEVQRQKMEQYEEAIREKQGDGLLP